MLITHAHKSIRFLAQLSWFWCGRPPEHNTQAGRRTGSPSGPPSRRREPLQNKAAKVRNCQPRINFLRSTGWTGAQRSGLFCVSFVRFSLACLVRYCLSFILTRIQFQSLKTFPAARLACCNPEARRQGRAGIGIGMTAFIDLECDSWTEWGATNHLVARNANCGVPPCPCRVPPAT